MDDAAHTHTHLLTHKHTQHAPLHTPLHTQHTHNQLLAHKFTQTQTTTRTHNTHTNTTHKTTAHTHIYTRTNRDGGMQVVAASEQKDFSRPSQPTIRVRSIMWILNIGGAQNSVTPAVGRLVGLSVGWLVCEFVSCLLVRWLRSIMWILNIGGAQNSVTPAVSRWVGLSVGRSVSFLIGWLVDW